MNPAVESDIYIRLTEDQMGFVCTEKLGDLCVESTEYSFTSSPMAQLVEEPAPAFLRKPSSQRDA